MNKFILVGRYGKNFGLEFTDLIYDFIENSYISNIYIPLEINRRGITTYSKKTYIMNDMIKVIKCKELCYEYE